MGLDQTVTENLSQIEGVKFCMVMAAGCFLVKIQLTMPLLLNAVMTALWKPSRDKPWPVLRLVLLMALTSFTTFAAVASAHAVAIVASLAGSLLTMTTSVLFPALMHFVLARQERHVGVAEYALHAF